MMIAPTLRKSILQAAISGRLTEQRAEDGDARDLLAAIQKKKTRLVREGKLKKEKALPAITEDEVPFEIPENWCWARFGDIMQFVSTGPFGTMLHKEDYVTNGTPLVNPMNMRDGNIIPSQNKSVSKETCERLTSYRLHEDDLVFARRGELGRCARVTKKEDGYLCGTGSFFAHPAGNIRPSYLVLLFKSSFIISYLMASSVGTTMNNLNHSILKKCPCPLPPLDEQDRIVQRMNDFQAELSKLESDEQQLDALETSFPSRMKASILQAAISGQLTEREAGDGDARELLAEIDREKGRLIKEKKIKREKALPPVDEEEVPFEIPENWCWCRLGNVCIVNPRNKPEDESINVSFLPMANIDAGFQNSFHPETRTWSRVKSNFTHFADGDVIFAKIKPCFENRKSAIMERLENGIGAGTTELHVLRRYGDTIDPHYLLYFVKNARFIYDGVATYTGTAGQQRVSTDFVKNYPFPLPPLAEQRRIVERVEEVLEGLE